MKLSTKVFSITGLLVLLVIGFTFWIYAPAMSEDRAERSMANFIVKSNIQSIARKSCSYDSDGDNLATCTVATDVETIQLQCASGVINTLPVIGSSSCKEMMNSRVQVNGIPVVKPK